MYYATFKTVVLAMTTRLLTSRADRLKDEDIHGKGVEMPKADYTRSVRYVISNLVKGPSIYDVHTEGGVKRR